MPEGRSSRWRGWLAGSLFLLALVAALVVARQKPPSEVVETERPTAAAPEPQAQPEPLAPPSPLSRGELIEAVQRARDAYAAGTPSPPANAALTGRRFRIALPLGCAAPQPDQTRSEPPAVSYDAERKTLRVSVSPENFTDAPFARAIAGERSFESAEGFWLDRPWTSSDACPQGAATPSGAAAPEPERSLAILRFFDPGTARAERRGGRPYRLVEKIGDEGLDLAAGLRLVIEGRLEDLGAGQPIGCWTPDARVRPVCAIGAQVDAISVTDAKGRKIGDWPG